MPLWGTRDSFSVSGTIAVSNLGSTTTVTGTSTFFTANTDIGDTLVIVGKRRKITEIANNTSLTIGDAWDGANQSGTTVTGQDTPKYLPASDISSNLIFGVSNTEAFVANNIANGISTPGWIRHQTYTDMHGNARKKTEILVAMNDLTSDAPDDVTVQDS